MMEEDGNTYLLYTNDDYYYFYYWKEKDVACLWQRSGKRLPLLGFFRIYTSLNQKSNFTSNMFAKNSIASKGKTILSRHLNKSVAGKRFLSSFSLALTDEQQAFKELARSFARDVMMPKSAEYDQTGEFPQEIFKQAWELGLVNTHIPVEQGGMGLHCLDGVIISEEFAYA